MQRRVKPEVTAAYAFASQLNLDRVQHLRAEQLRLEMQKAQVEARMDSELARKHCEVSALQREVAEAQRSQMQQELARKQQLRAEKKEPGISPTCCGYPSIPQTPPNLRKSRKLEQQQLLKAELERQVQSRQRRLQDARASDLQLVSRMISAVELRREQEQAEERQRKLQQREDLWQAWREAERVKKEQQLILTGHTPLPLRFNTESAVAEDTHRDVALSVSKPMATSLTPVAQAQSPINLHWRKSLALRLKAREDGKARNSIELQLSSQRKRLLLAGKLMTTSQHVLSSRVS